jgi:cell wall-associated NlpC family hydrolase
MAVLLAISAATTPIVLGSTAGAQSIAQTRAEIAALSAQLNAESKQSEISANKYDAIEARFGQLSSDVRVLQYRIRRKQAQIAATKKVLTADVVRAFIDGAAAAQIEALFNQSVTSSDARNVYSNLVVGNVSRVRNRLVRENTALNHAISQVSSTRAQAKAQAEQMQSLLAQNIAAQNQTQHTLNVVTASLRTEIIAYEVAAGAQAAKHHDIYAEEQAVNAASQVGGQAAANQVIEAIRANTPPANYGGGGGSAQGAAALRAAETQVGVPYVWGGETPGSGFDCSGLVQWAWARAGVSIPRTTEEQWAALPHVSMHDLQPGDLIYYYNLDGDNAVDHVVMYAGSGPWGTSTIIAAAHTGTNISLAPLFTFGLIGAARP